MTINVRRYSEMYGHRKDNPIDLSGQPPNTSRGAIINEVEDQRPPRTSSSWYGAPRRTYQEVEKDNFGA